MHRVALLIIVLAALPASELRAQDMPSSKAYPGSFWLSAGDVGPAERDNVAGQAAFEQGLTVWQRDAWFLIPYVGATLMTDSAGYDWNNRHPGQIGMKLVRRVPGGVVQAAGGILFERDPSTDEQRHGTAFVSYWAGWAAEGRAQHGARFGEFPGHVSAHSGLITGRDPHNWMTTVGAQQGVVVFRNRFLAAVPYGSGAVSFDTKRRVWENRVTLDAGFKVVRPLVGGVVEAGVAERRQYTVLTDSVDTAPVAYVNLWIGWNPRTVSRR